MFDYWRKRQGERMLVIIGHDDLTRYVCSFNKAARPLTFSHFELMLKYLEKVLGTVSFLLHTKMHL